MSGLYFRGKLTYATAFGRPAADGEAAVLIITPTRGLQLPEALIGSDVIREFAVGRRGCRRRSVSGAASARSGRAGGARAGGRPRRAPGQRRDRQYVDLLAAALGGRLHYPPTFIGRGDMSRGGLLLRSAAAGVNWSMRCSTPRARRHGPRPAKLERLRTPLPAEAETQLEKRAREIRRAMVRVESAGIRQHPQPRALDRLLLRTEDGGRAIEGRPVGHHADDGDDPRPERRTLRARRPSAGAKFGRRELVGGRGRARDEIRDAAAEGQQFAAVAGATRSGVKPEANSAGQKRLPGRAKW